MLLIAAESLHITTSPGASLLASCVDMMRATQPHTCTDIGPDQLLHCTVQQTTTCAVHDHQNTKQKTSVGTAHAQQLAATARWTVAFVCMPYCPATVSCLQTLLPAVLAAACQTGPR